MNTNKIIGEVVNLGTNYEISILDLAFLISKLMSSNINIINDDERIRPEKSEVDRLLSDNKKAKTILDWTPNKSGLSGLKEGLKETIHWFKDPDNLKMYKIDKYNV